MSHFVVGVVLPKKCKPGSEEKAVQRLLAPYEEGGTWFKRKNGHEGRAKWDWYQIGGRWSGMLLQDYKPEEDPRNIVTCELCNGTGDRKDLGPPEWKKECGGCNGCHGKGKRPKWPTQFAPAPEGGDIGTVESALALKDDGGFPFFAVVTPNGEWNERGEMGWFGCATDEKPRDEWAKDCRAILEAHKGHRVVVVDCHI